MYDVGACVGRETAAWPPAHVPAPLLLSPTPLPSNRRRFLPTHAAASRAPLPFTTHRHDAVTPPLESPTLTAPAP
ncbi:hypothetical protein GCM10009850_084540 [Nonomuraea monospora]|uniref:Uncharacterized protein n=1 Tax=Nonomuraea monospora TaxID=568818 RepID=A0ABN3CU57_9ACTN